jgi:sulfur-oxidizing protein SoxA
MKKLLLTATATCLLATASLAVNAATPEDDMKAFRDYYAQRFPDVPFANFKDGVYALDAASREQWQTIEEFPPYEGDIEKGEGLFNSQFANGKSLNDCFPNGGKNIKQNYPYWDAESQSLVTIESAINKCRADNGEKPYGLKKGDIAAVSAYIAFNSRGEKIDVKIPQDQKAVDAYNRGKKHFYAKRGQLNMSCADCHQYNSGNKIRADILSPALGHTTGFPVYRSAWGELGTLHRRYGGCNEQVRAKAFPAQSDEYKALEYFETYMGNGLEINGPSSRK